MTCSYGINVFLLNAFIFLLTISAISISPYWLVIASLKFFLESIEQFILLATLSILS